MSKEASDINDALRLYRMCEGTDAEQAALEHLEAVVERVKRQTSRPCCGGACRFCPERRAQ